jgi:hypothetical protein
MFENIECPGCCRLLTRVKGQPFFCDFCNIQWSSVPNIETYLFKEDPYFKTIALDIDDPQKNKKLRDYESVFGPTEKFSWAYSDDDMDLTKPRPYPHNNYLGLDKSFEFRYLSTWPYKDGYEED